MTQRAFPAIGQPLYRATALCVVIVACISCKKETSKDSAKSADSSAVKKSVAVPAAAGAYTLKDFVRLQWLEGSWRGQLPDGRGFYERYRVLDDSTIRMRAFADSAFDRVTDSARITLRAGTVADEGRARWVATRLDSTGVDFASERNASNNFTWARVSPNSWKAVLNSTDKNGQVQTVVYPMQRIRR